MGRADSLCGTSSHPGPVGRRRSQSLSRAVATPLCDDPRTPQQNARAASTRNPRRFGERVDFWSAVVFLFFDSLNVDHTRERPHRRAMRACDAPLLRHSKNVASQRFAARRREARRLRAHRLRACRLGTCRLRTCRFPNARLPTSSRASTVGRTPIPHRRRRRSGSFRACRARPRPGSRPCRRPGR